MCLVYIHYRENAVPRIGIHCPLTGRKNEGEGQAERAALKETVTIEGHSQPYWDPESEE